MSETVDKVYCVDRSDNNALLASMIAGCNRRNDDVVPMMAAMQQNQQWNNPFAYLIWMMFANRFMGNNWGGDMNGQAQQNVEVQNQLQAIRTQLQDNQNSNLLMDAVKGNEGAIRELSCQLNVNYNSLRDALCDIRTGIARFGDQIGFSAERVINAINLGNTGILQAVSNCCCETQKELIRMNGNIDLKICQQTGELRNGQRDLGQAITQGFAAIGYQESQNKSEIIRAGEMNTQRIMDLLNAHWSNEQAREIQDLKNENALLKQTERLLAAYGGGCCGGNPNYGCGC